MIALEPLKSGDLIGDYQVDKLLGRGGQAFVYRVRDKLGHQYVAKELAPLGYAKRVDQSKLSWTKDNSPVMAEWQNHFELSQSVTHSAIYRFDKQLSANNTLYLIGDYLAGQTLFEHLNQICFDKHMPQSRLIRLILPVIQGLNYLHKNALVHGDIKPANLYITLENKVLILDGINDGEGRIDYSEGFSAPEIKQHKSVTPQSDYYSFGALLAYLVTGEQLQPNAKLGYLSQYDGELLKFIEACLAEIPKQRPDSLKALVDIFKRLQLSSYEQDKLVDAPTVKISRQPEQSSRTLILPYASAVFAALLVPLIWLSWPISELEPDPQPIAPIEDNVVEANHYVELKQNDHSQLVKSEPLETNIIDVKHRNLDMTKKPPQPLEREQKQLRTTPKVIETLLDNMVAFPAGEFWLGSSNGSPSERPVYKVNVDGFKLLSHEVTYGLYNQCVEQGFCVSPSQKGAGNQPVSGVSFLDIQNHFIPWLNQMSEFTFRLPSEVEWEYGAKFGVGEGYAWGSDFLANAANCRDCEADFSGRKASPVKSFEPSEVGLFDMNGNLEEWVDECWKPNHESSAVSGCKKVTVKGGSWDSRKSGIRNSARRGEDAGRRSSGLGFRLALSDNSQSN